MKYNRIVLVYSIVIGVISLIAYSIFGYIECMLNFYIKDISLAVLGSASFVIVTSIIGYLLEKRRTTERIINAFCSFSIANFILEEGLKLNQQSLARLANVSYNRNNTMYMALKEYYQGCFFKDEKLKEIINEEIIPYAQKIANFRVTVAKIIEDPNNKSSNIEEKFNELWHTEQEISNHIDAWMVEKGFLLGKEFNIEDNQKEQQNG